MSPRSATAEGQRRAPETMRRKPHDGCAGCLARPLAVCASLPEDLTYVLEASAGQLRLPAGATLVREGTPRREVYTMTHGMMRRVRLLPDGRRLVAGFLMPGDFIGLTGDSHHRHTLEAVTDCAMCVFSLTDMRALCERHPELESGLLGQACSELDAARSSLMSLARMTPLERLAGFLLDMSQRQRQRGGEPSRVELPMTRADIADHLGLTVETVSRSFTRLKREDVVRFEDPHHIELHAPDRLRLLAGFAAA
ncbi:Crp/Fnr family transcriptional regulator [Luteimonas huabeiensis]|uniref:Crp/Fnr family transcriptional regulator n=1 Tax=Luteimonas huabeiensis TaxID=1244513 RepID=UPI0004652FFC|nr:Crp/Fnr family transcriptional regulator [Luteimonas huabeiensis]